MLLKNIYLENEDNDKKYKKDILLMKEDNEQLNYDIINLSAKIIKYHQHIMKNLITDIYQKFS